MQGKFVAVIALFGLKIVVHVKQKENEMNEKYYFKKKAAGFKAFGETKSFKEWERSKFARKNNLTYNDLYNRIVVHGWEPERALTTPIGGAYGLYNTTPKKGHSVVRKNAERERLGL